MTDKNKQTNNRNTNAKLLETEVLETEAASPETGLIDRVAWHGQLFSSLRFREYRYLWSGALLSNTGTWIQSVALGWFVFQVTNSEFTLGLVNFAATIPTFFLVLLGGVIADRYERRSLLIIGQTILMALAFMLGILVSFNIASIPFIIGLSLAAGIANSFTFPAWQAFIPELVPKKELLNAIALNSAQFNVARLIGPATAGFIISLLGVSYSFYINAASFLAVIIALTFIKPRPNLQRGVSQNPWQNFLAGIHYARENRVIAVLLISVGTLTIFGLSHTVLMPVFARDILKVGAQGLGYLMAVGGFGAVLGALLVAGLSHTIRRNTLIKAGVLTYSVFLLIFAFSKTFLVSLLAQFFIGIAFLTAVSSINTAIQASTPANIRGRVMSLYIWAFLGVFPIGSFLIGTVAKLFGSSFAVAGGALILLLVAGILYICPELLKEAG